MGSRACRGITLVEILAVSVIMIIVFGMAVPSMVRMAERNHATTTVNWLLGSIHYARHAAIIRGTTVTLCPSTDKIVCRGHWHDGIIAFTDRNQDAQINGKDEIIGVFHSPADGSTIKWRSFRNRQYLQMTKDGITNYQNGNFVYCSKDQDPLYSRQIVINVAGRPRQSRDRNGDGIVDDRRGKPLRC